MKENTVFNFHYTCHLGTRIVHSLLRNHLNRLSAPYGFGEMENADGKGAGDHNNTLAIAI